MQKGFSYNDICRMHTAEFDEWIELLRPEPAGTVHNNKQIEIDDDE